MHCTRELLVSKESTMSLERDREPSAMPLMAKRIKDRACNTKACHWLMKTTSVKGEASSHSGEQVHAFKTLFAFCVENHTIPFLLHRECVHGERLPCKLSFGSWLGATRHPAKPQHSQRDKDQWFVSMDHVLLNWSCCCRTWHSGQPNPIWASRGGWHNPSLEVQVWCGKKVHCCHARWDCWCKWLEDPRPCSQLTQATLEQGRGWQEWFVGASEEDWAGLGSGRWISAAIIYAGILI